MTSPKYASVFAKALFAIFACFPYLPKLTIFKRRFVPILIYGNKSWVKILRSQVHTSEIMLLEESKELHNLTRCVALRFKNL